MKTKINVNQEQIDRFYDSVKLNQITGCLEWIKSLTWNGYGQTSINNVMFRSHRLAWIIKYSSIPDGMLVLHKCDNRKCVEIDHLYLGDQKQNIKDREKRCKTTNGNKTHCRHGHEFNKENTYIYKNKMSEHNGMRICKKCHANREKERRKRIKNDVIAI